MTRDDSACSAEFIAGWLQLTDVSQIIINVTRGCDSFSTFNSPFSTLNSQLPHANHSPVSEGGSDAKNSPVNDWPVASICFIVAGSNTRPPGPPFSGSLGLMI